MLWDATPEPVCVIHLHNMLVAKGYIKKPIGLFSVVEEIFSTSFFVDGKAPTSNFNKAFLAVAIPRLDEIFTTIGAE